MANKAPAMHTRNCREQEADAPDSFNPALAAELQVQADACVSTLARIRRNAAFAMKALQRGNSSEAERLMYEVVNETFQLENMWGVKVPSLTS